jgi:hypothetical protein
MNNNDNENEKSNQNITISNVDMYPKKIIIENCINTLQKNGKNLEFDTYSILKDDITNYRKLSEYQLLYIEHLTEMQKIEIIKLYDRMFHSIKDILYD